MAIDATVIGVGNISSGTTLVSAAGDSTGFTKFLAVVTNFVNTAGDLNGNSFADSKGNAYVKVLWNGIGTGDAAMAGGDGVISYFLCESGTGGTGHTATCTLPQAPFGATIKLIGISGALSTSFDLATSSTGTIAVGTAMTVATGTLGQAIELLIATTIYDTDAGGGASTVTGWSSGAMTLIGNDVTPTGGATPVTSAIGKQVSAATTSITASITPTGTGISTHQYVMAVATFKAATALNLLGQACL